MTAKEKAKELVEKYKDYVHGYVGSSMLTNYEYPEQILSQAKKASIICVDEIIENLEYLCISHLGTYKNPKISFFNEVKTEIEDIAD